MNIANYPWGYAAAYSVLQITAPLCSRSVVWYRANYFTGHVNTVHAYPVGTKGKSVHQWQKATSFVDSK
eukprot:6428293-Ditylum_brightwellii.AAC.1